MGRLPETISLSEIKKVVALAKLSIPDIDLEQFFLEINDILSHFDKLNRLELKEVSPTSHISWSQPPSNPDEPREWMGGEELFSQAPAVIEQYFIVPKVVDKQEE